MIWGINNFALEKKIRKMAHFISKKIKKQALHNVFAHELSFEWPRLSILYMVSKKSTG